MKIELNCFSRREHCAQVVTNFIHYSKKYNIPLKINNCLNSDYKFKNIPLIEVIIDNATLIFDCEDGYPEDANTDTDWMAYYLKKCDFYFKRSFSVSANLPYEDKHKIKPLGFNYFLSCKGNPYEYEFLTGIGKVKKIIKYLLGEVLHDENYYRNNDRNQNEGYIIFLTRLWSENVNSDINAMQRKNINAMRIELIRRLRNRYGDKFIGGLYDNDISRALAPDLIVNKKITKQKYYLKKMKKAYICIASTGLHESIGWKFAEYICAGKIIVSEKLKFSVPGHFKAGIDGNYLEFNDVDECISIIDSIMEKEIDTNKILENNKKYYQEYMKPEAVIEYVLKEITRN